MKPATKFIVYTLLCLIWSSTWIMIKIGLEGAPPMLGAGIRFALASLAIGAIILAGGKALPRSKEFYLLSLFLGFFQMGIPYALVYWGEQFISSGLTAVLFSFMPIGVALLARIVLGDPLTARKLLGIVLGMTGVSTIFYDGLGYEGADPLLGMIAIVASALLAALSSVAIKRYGFRYDPIVSIFLPITIGAVLLLAAGFLLEDPSTVHLNAPTVFTIIYLALVGTVSAFALYFWIIKHIDVTFLSYQTFIIPVVAVLLGWIALGEEISLRAAAGASLILGGIALSTTRRRNDGRTHGNTA